MRKEQLQRYWQYLQLYVRHSTLKKIKNLINIETKLLCNTSNMDFSFPYYLVVEISNTCNLACPLCQMGQRKIIPRENKMTFENYKKVIHPIQDYLYQVLLYDWGEPFLNKDIYDIITYNTQNNISSVVSTNANISIDPLRVLESGLEYLIISGDGITQDIYSQYRVGGDIKKVLKNLEGIVKLKKKHKSTYPVIEWQCLVTKYNEHCLDEIKETVLRLGVDRVRFANINFYSIGENENTQEEWLPQNPQFRFFKHNIPQNRRTRKPCFWLWRSAVVNVNGGLTPCCLYDIPDWGNVLDDSFTNVWKNPTFQEARLRSKNNGSFKRQALKCDSCTAPFIYR